MEKIDEHLSAFWIALFFSLLINSFAWKRGFFKYKPGTPAPVKGIDVLKGFLYFVSAQMIIIPASVLLLFSVIYGTDSTRVSHWSIQAQGWFNVLTVLGGFAAILLVLLAFPAHKRQLIWGDSTKWFRHLLMGAMTWLISYPVVLAIDQLVSIFVLTIFQEPQIDQVAVKHFKHIMGHPLLFWATSLVVVVFVPIVEEFLFRGLLQSWLRRKIPNIKVAIALTSLIFAFFHFSSSQGASNIEYLVSLFVLSCFLGFLYEREHSLWAPIGLHAFFNGMSIVMLVTQN